MTDNEIIEMVKKSAGYGDFSVQGGETKIFKEIDDLITCQKLALDHGKRIIKDLENTIENLKTVEYPYIIKCNGNAKIHTKSLTDYGNLIVDIKREAIEAFAERLKDSLDWRTEPMDEYEIDELVKEMTGEDNEKT